MMNFEMLKDLKRGDVLVGIHGAEYSYIGKSSLSNHLIIVETIKGVYHFDEGMIKNWTIKKPEPKKLGEVVTVRDTRGNTYMWEEVTIKGNEIFEVENEG